MIVIDEIGKMELFSRKFENAVRDIFRNKNIQVIATVPLKGKLNIVEQLKQNEDCQLFTVSILIWEIFVNSFDFFFTGKL